MGGAIIKRMAMGIRPMPAKMLGFAFIAAGAFLFFPKAYPQDRPLFKQQERQSHLTRFSHRLVGIEGF